MKRRITAIALVLVMVLSTVSFPAELGEGLTEELTADAVFAEDDLVIGEEDPEEFVFEDTGEVDDSSVILLVAEDPEADLAFDEAGNAMVVDEPQPEPEESTVMETETDLVSMLFSDEAAESEPDQGLVLSASTEPKIIRTENGTDDTEYLFEKFVERQLYGTVSGSVTPSAKAPKLLAAPRVAGVDLLAYNALKAQIEDAAAGRRSSTEFTISLDDLGLAGENWTAEELGVETLIVDGSISKEASDAVSAKLYDLDKVLSALLNTLPFDLYWHDKTAGVLDSGARFSYHYDSGKSDFVLEFAGEITISFAVASEYALSTYEVNTQIGTAVEAAGNKAAEIVANYASSADYEKLLGYKNEICSLVSYNYSAVSTPTEYGNPWQLIWVFDGDPATDVVCEGYSKAFKYLCDLTSFSSSQISCITVTGTMSGGTGAGAHMWDVVRMGNGKNYLVDVTNCDAGSIGADDLLFLAGYSNGNMENGYIFSCGSEYITFKYDNKTTGYYGEEDLVLSASAYTAHYHTPAQERTGVKAATCTEPGYTGDTLCMVCGEVMESGAVVPATGHIPSEERIGVKAATCTEPGYTGDVICTVCGEVMESGTVVPATGHNWLPGEIISEATCTEAGEEKHVCSICGLTETVTIQALGHQHTEVRDAREATCAAEGYSGDVYCSDCGQLVSGGHSMEKLAHTWDEGVIVREPDADADGLKVYTCSVCGERKEEVIEYQAPLQDVSAAEVTISAQTYTGNKLTPAPVVKVDGKALVKGTDYTVGAYSDNINVGTGKVTITGIGKYTGTVTAEFKINKAAQSITVKTTAASVAVGKTATVSISGAKGKITYKSSNKAIADVNTSGKVTAKKVGTVKITVASEETANYKPASKTVTIKVVLAATGSLKAANLATGIKLTWAKVTGASGYKVYRNGTLIKTIKSGSTVTYTDAKANTNGTKYTFKIIATASTGTSPLSRSVTTYRVSKPAISSAANTAAGKMTVKWKKNAKASGYQIQYSLSKTFASGNKSLNIAKVGTLSKVIGSLKKGKTYYVRMRTYKTVGSTKYYSVWSAKKAVKISK